MSDITYAIMGASGLIGHILCQELLKRGHKVRAIGRNEDKLNELKAKGAETAFVDFTSAAGLSTAFKGAKAVFSFMPPGYFAEGFAVYQDTVSEAIVQALKKSNTTHVLNLSSIGANLDKGTGPILEFYHHEKRMDALSDVNIVHLRPSYLMEILQLSIPFIKKTGTNGSALRGDIPIPMVATRDIGFKAAQILDTLDFKGHTVFEFTGPGAWTLQEATTIIGKAIGKPDLQYIQLSEDEERKIQMSAGKNSIIIDLWLEMYKAYNTGIIRFTQEMTPEHKGPTSFEEFSRAFAETYAYIC